MVARRGFTVLEVLLATIILGFGLTAILLSMTQAQKTMLGSAYLETVQEVMDGKYYESRPISIRKDEEGNWTEAPEYWYLIITKSKKMKYEFGRFKCAISAEGR